MPRARQSGPKWPKSPPLTTSLTKNPYSPSKKLFFECRLEDLPCLFETFTRFVEHTRPEKFPYKPTCVQTFFFWKSPKAARCQRVNLDHNFWTWNPSRSSKVSKDSDCSLVSNKNFSKILPSNLLVPRARWSWPRWPKSPLLMTSLTKNLHPQPKKIFFECKLQDLPRLLTLRPGS